MKREIKHPNRGDWRGGAFSAAVEMDGWVYVSGYGPIDMITGEYISGTIEEETTLVLRNIQEVLGAAGCSLDDVAKATAHISSMDDFREFNRAYRDFFREVQVLPVRTTVQSVLWGGMKVEIDVVARKPQASKAAQP